MAVKYWLGDFGVRGERSWVGGEFEWMRGDLKSGAGAPQSKMIEAMRDGWRQDAMAGRSEPRPYNGAGR
jgi:hypothetical protein